MLPTTNLDYLSISNHQCFQGVDVTDKTKILSASLALAVSRLLALPTSVIDNPFAYFNGTLRPTFINIVGSFNERVLVDCDHVVELIRSFWSVRYHVVHPDFIVPSGFGFFDTIVGVGQFFDNETYAFLTQYKDIILCLNDEIYALIKGEFAATN